LNFQSLNQFKQFWKKVLNLILGALDRDWPSGLASR
jgi:hypothetical protein